MHVLTSLLSLPEIWTSVLGKELLLLMLTLSADHVYSPVLVLPVQVIKVLAASGSVAEQATTRRFSKSCCQL